MRAEHSGALQDRNLDMVIYGADQGCFAGPVTWMDVRCSGLICNWTAASCPGTSNLEDRHAISIDSEAPDLLAVRIVQHVTLGTVPVSHGEALGQAQAKPRPKATKSHSHLSMRMSRSTRASRAVS